MMPDQESLCSRRASMISPLLEMHNSNRFHRLVGHPCDDSYRQRLVRLRIVPLLARDFQRLRSTAPNSSG
jgi:hypothetical protein